MKIWQQNINKSLTAQLDMLESIKKDYDLVLVEEPYVDFRGLSRTNPYYSIIYPPRHRDTFTTKSTRSIIMVNNKLQSNAWAPILIDSSDITAVEVTTASGIIRIINIYNDCNHNDSLTKLRQYMGSAAARSGRQQPVKYIWAGDFNRHHPLWDEERNAHLFTNANLEAAEPLITLLAQHDMKMALPEGTPTLQALATGNLTRPDNVFCSRSLIDHFISCQARPEEKPVKADHFPVRSELDLAVAIKKYEPRPNLRKVDWEKFRETLAENLGTIPPPGPITTKEEFEATLENFEDMVQKTMKKCIPMTKPSPYSKRWWTPN
jgi:hypothetical protein